MQKFIAKTAQSSAGGVEVPNGTQTSQILAKHSNQRNLK